MEHAIVSRCVKQENKSIISTSLSSNPYSDYTGAVSLFWLVIGRFGNFLSCEARSHIVHQDRVRWSVPVLLGHKLVILGDLQPAPVGKDQPAGEQRNPQVRHVLPPRHCKDTRPQTRWTQSLQHAIPTPFPPNRHLVTAPSSLQPASFLLLPARSYALPGCPVAL